MLKFSIFFIFLFHLSQANAGVDQLSEEEFRALAGELAPRVDLFRTIWQQDPDAVFYGGTTRDFLYWLKGKFRGAKNRREALKMAQELNKLSVIDVGWFIVGDSDIDVISATDVSVNSRRFGVRKIDKISPAIFDSHSELGKNEIDQGYAPAEKIRLGRSGISQAKEFGDGLREIYNGKLSVHFADPKVFAQTKYARDGLNHPVLLALRYLRLQSINYYHTYGQGYPDSILMRDSLDPQSRKEVRKVILLALKGKELRPYLNNPRFLSWLNGTMQKSFRSYTNPTAALEYMKMFSADQLPVVYQDDKVEPLNQYVFAKFRDEKAIAEALKKYKVKADFFQDPGAFFSDGYFYHGTKTELAFRSIVFRGILPSAGGTVGNGLYGVSQSNMPLAMEYAADDSRNLVKLQVAPEARVVDITAGEGARVWQAFLENHLAGNAEEFADTFGIDILKYSYKSEAFVVKNSSVLTNAAGVYKQPEKSWLSTQLWKHSPSCAIILGNMGPMEFSAGQKTSSALGVVIGGYEWWNWKRCGQPAKEFSELSLERWTVSACAEALEKTCANSGTKKIFCPRANFFASQALGFYLQSHNDPTEDFLARILNIQTAEELAVFEKELPLFWEMPNYGLHLHQVCMTKAHEFLEMTPDTWSESSCAGIMEKACVSPKHKEFCQRGNAYAAQALGLALLKIGDSGIRDGKTILQVQSAEGLAEFEKQFYRRLDSPLGLKYDSMQCDSAAEYMTNAKSNGWTEESCLEIWKNYCVVPGTERKDFCRKGNAFSLQALGLYILEFRVPTQRDLNAILSVRTQEDLKAFAMARGRKIHGNRFSKIPETAGTLDSSKNDRE